MEQTLSNRRRYLTEDELEKLMKAARNGRYGRRDATLMLLMARHGLRVLVVDRLAELRNELRDLVTHSHDRLLPSGSLC